MKAMLIGALASATAEPGAAGLVLTGEILPQP
jgi:hypothetical protein